MPTASRSSSRKRSGKTARPSLKFSDVHEALAELLQLGDRGWVVSCYQKLEPADRVGEKYRIKLKNRLRRAAERVGIVGFPHAEREAIGAALKAIEDFFQYPSNLGGGRGIAVFAAQGLFRAVTLPAVLRSRVVIDRTAVVGELVSLSESGTSLLAVVADRRSARLFSVTADGADEIEGVILPEATRAGRFSPNRASMPGAGEYRYHSRIREEKHRHLENVSEAIGRAWRRGGFDGLAIGGIGVAADALLPHLDSALRDRVVGVMKLSPKSASAAEIKDRALELLADAADASAADAVGELSGLLRTGWAVDGTEATLKALARGQIRTLVVDHDAAVAGFRLASSGRLTTIATGAKGEGEALPVTDVLDDAIEEALRQRIRVHVVRGSLAGSFNTVGGILRFRENR